MSHKTGYRNWTLGPSRLSVNQRDLLTAGYLRCQRDEQMRKARNVLNSAGSIEDAKRLARGYVRQARYFQQSYLLQLSTPAVQS